MNIPSSKTPSSSPLTQTGMLSPPGSDLDLFLQPQLPRSPPTLPQTSHSSGKVRFCGHQALGPTKSKCSAAPLDNSAFQVI